MANVQWKNPPTAEEVREQYITQTRREMSQAVQAHLDTTAQQRNYDGILSLCTYATSANATFAAEGQAGVEWRDAVWAECYALLDQVLADEIPVPSEDELIAMLPTFSWPE